MWSKTLTTRSIFVFLQHVRPSVFFFNDTATTEIYTLSLHDALPIFVTIASLVETEAKLKEERPLVASVIYNRLKIGMPRSEEHTSELQSRQYPVCRLLLEKKKTEHTSELQSRQSSIYILPFEKELDY